MLRLPSGEADLGYLAGLLDGEGCISLRSPNRNGYRGVQVAISNTHKPVIDWLATLGGAMYEKQRADGPRATIWIWQLGARADVVLLLDALLPYMRIKRARAEEALAHLLAPDREEG